MIQMKSLDELLSQQVPSEALYEKKNYSCTCCLYTPLGDNLTKQAFAKVSSITDPIKFQKNEHVLYFTLWFKSLSIN